MDTFIVTAYFPPASRNARHRSTAYIVPAATAATAVLAMQSELRGAALRPYALAAEKLPGRFMNLHERALDPSDAARAIAMAPFSLRWDSQARGVTARATASAVAEAAA